MCPLPSRERAARWFNKKEWVRGQAATPHPAEFVETLVLPSPAKGRGRNKGCCHSRLCQSCGSSLISAAPWLLPTQNVGGVVLLSTNTRRTLVWCGSGYSVILPVSRLSRRIRSAFMPPVHKCPSLAGAAS